MTRASCRSRRFTNYKISRGLTTGDIRSDRSRFSGRPVVEFNLKLGRVVRIPPQLISRFSRIYIYIYPRGRGQRQNCRVKLISSQIPSSARRGVVQEQPTTPGTVCRFELLQRVRSWNTDRTKKGREAAEPIGAVKRSSARARIKRFILLARRGLNWQIKHGRASVPPKLHRLSRYCQHARVAFVLFARLGQVLVSLPGAFFALAAL